ncbi:MAG: PEP-CTERM sorting domain-containing protein [Phycisphaerales bacterium]
MRKFCSIVMFSAIATIAQAALITDNLAVHFDASSGALSNEAGGVYRWEDQSNLGGMQIAGNGTASKQPIFVQNAIGDKAAVRFDGIDDWLVMNDNFSNNELDTDTISFFIVFKSDLESTQSIARAKTSFHSSHWGAYYDGSSKLIWHSRDNALGFVGAGNVLSDSGFENGFYIFTGIWYENDVVASRLNMETGTGKAGANSPSGTFTKMLLGTNTSVNGEYFKGDIAEILIYNTALENTDRDSVESYLYNKYVPEPATIALFGLGLVTLFKRK